MGYLGLVLKFFLPRQKNGTHDSQHQDGNEIPAE
jgi:hypothetical protein